jgi:hypothetical protein
MKITSIVTQRRFKVNLQTTSRIDRAVSKRVQTSSTKVIFLYDYTFFTEVFINHAPLMWRSYLQYVILRIFNKNTRLTEYCQ